MNKQYTCSVTFDKEAKAIIVTGGDLTVTKRIQGHAPHEVVDIVEELVDLWFKSQAAYSITGF